ncbi:MAG: Ezrin/radixin/moesin family protein [Cytophagales bacterium]|nr:Ezrin/radixin/moesin family protein [Cytophagales bacterium]
MIKSTSSILALLILFTSQLVVGQDDKKVWAKKMKETDPLEFKRIVEENASLQSEKSGLTSALAESQKIVGEKDTEISELKRQLEEAKSSTSSAPAAEPAPAQSQSVVPHVEPNAQGVIFKVQIGAFKNKDLTKYFDNSKFFSGDVDEDGTKKYTVGYFSEYWEANNFKKYLREMGVKDAWIVPYKGQKRLNVKDVLEGVIE